MKLRHWFLAGFLCILIIGGNVIVSEAAEEIGLSFTPRVQLTRYSQNAYINSTTYQATFDDYEAPLYGGTIAYSPKFLESTQISFTILTGDDNGVGRLQSGGTSSAVEWEEDRTDIDLAVRHGIQGASVFWGYGIRWINMDWKETTTTLTYPTTGTNSYEDETNVYIGHIDVGLIASITQDQKHNFFGGLSLLFGFQECEVQNALPSATDVDEEDEAYGFDINVGYQWLFSDKSSAHFRYRGTIYTDGDDTTAVYGPEIGFTINF